MKHFFVKLFLFGVIVYLAQLMWMHFYPYPLPWAVSDILSYQKAKDDIIYFGDSSVGWFSRYDTNTNSIAAMLGIILEQHHSLGEITHNSFHAGMYNEYTAYMSKIGYFPKYVIIPINLRSFSPEWYLRPQYQFIDEILYLHLHNTFASPFLTFLINVTIPDINRIDDTIYALAPVYDGNTQVGNDTSFTNKMSAKSPVSIRIPAMIQMAYFGPLEKSKRLGDFMKIADRYQSTHTQVIFYITPLDYQTGEKYFGTHYDALTSQYITQIKTTLTQHGALVLDYSRLQKSDNFIWKEDGYINEHLNQKGRHNVAEYLAKEIDPDITKEELSATQSSTLLSTQK